MGQQVRKRTKKRGRSKRPKNHHHHQQQHDAVVETNDESKQTETTTRTVLQQQQQQSTTTTTTTTPSFKVAVSPKQETKKRSMFHFLSQFASDFPIIAASLTVLIPYGIYLLYFVLLLQHPEYLFFVNKYSNYNIRPAITDLSERQVLIVGTMGSGSTQVAHELSKQLKLEIGHEVSDAAWYFCRDGTVSWFHGIRFFDKNINPIKLCGNFTKNMGFHPRLFSAETNCSKRKAWSACWERECVIRVIREWKCERRRDCVTPFKYNLHLMRNPLRTIESLLVKFCEGNSLANGTTHPAFVHVASSLFPESSFDGSCIEAVTTYVVEYNKMMLRAHHDGLIHGSFQIENTSPCQVAKLAGFLDQEHCVYEPHHNRLATLCETNNNNNSNNNSSELSFFAQEQNTRNLGFVNLAWEDLRGGMHNNSHSRPKGDRTMERMVKDLFVKMGYSVKREREVSDIPEF